jgi:hypothetical protein
VRWDAEVDTGDDVPREARRAVPAQDKCAGQSAADTSIGALSRSRITGRTIIVLKIVGIELRTVLWVQIIRTIRVPTGCSFQIICCQLHTERDRRHSGGHLHRTGGKQGLARKAGRRTRSAVGGGGCLAVRPHHPTSRSKGREASRVLERGREWRRVANHCRRRGGSHLLPQSACPATAPGAFSLAPPHDLTS